ncbi:MAG TPA: hypothetical protein VMG34_14860 [Bacteroidota bacterium]|nr:hypothetical protein [Bacteroidota bacterium]
MRLCFVIAALLLLAGPLRAQDPLASPEMEQVMTIESFSDVVKSVWDVIKKGADDYHDETLSRSEFETASDFEARLQQRRNDIAARIQTFAETKKLSERIFATWYAAKLVRYDADTQIFTVTSPTELPVPPTTEDITTVCAPNPYISLVESSRRGYKFANLLLKAKQEYSWHVDIKTARTAKGDEPNVAFKVWFRFDLSQAFTGTTAQLVIVPVRVALMNRGTNTTYWSEDLTK